MKGPMTTQTLRGLVEQRPDALARRPLQRLLRRRHRRGAVVRQLHRRVPGPARARGRSSTTADMQAFTDFALQLTLPPNPMRALDNSLTPISRPGTTSSSGSRRADGIVVRQRPRLQLQRLPRARSRARASSAPTATRASRTRSRSSRSRTCATCTKRSACSACRRCSFLNAGDNGNKGDQIRGFGFLHDGSIDTVFRFLQATVFNNANGVGFDGPSNGDVQAPADGAVPARLRHRPGADRRPAGDADRRPTRRSPVRASTC